jgi:hypothetical protein
MPLQSAIVGVLKKSIEQVLMGINQMMLEE